MYAKERQDAILKILEKHEHVTVKELVDTLFFSTATINRDLNTLKKQNLIVRSFGGVELNKKFDSALAHRYEVMSREKDRIGYLAAKEVTDGDIIFIAASTTTQAMIPYLKKNKKLVVITNNLAAASYLSSHGIGAICLGGHIREVPYFTGSEDTLNSIPMYHATKMFFSSTGMTTDGKIVASMYRTILKAMMRNSDKIYYLTDHSKIGADAKIYLGDLGLVDTVISDVDISDGLKDLYPNVEFISADNTKKSSSK